MQLSYTSTEVTEFTMHIQSHVLPVPTWLHKALLRCNSLKCHAINTSNATDKQNSKQYTIQDVDWE